MGCWSNPTTKDAYRLSIASLVIEFLAALSGIVFFMDSGSSLVLVYGLENVVDFMSTIVVLWRFFAPASLDDALEQKLQQREQRASVAISIIMVILGLSILATSLSDFARGPEDTYQEEAVLMVSLVSFLFFGILAVLKFRFAARLESPSMRKDGICALIGCVLAVTLFINTIIVIRNPDLWWIDPIVAFAAGIAAMCLGAQAVWESYTSENLPIFSTSWWFDASPIRSADDSGIDTTSTKVGDENQVV